MVFDSVIREMKRSQGIEPVGDLMLIDERKQGFLTYRFEIQPETWNGQPALRLIVTEFTGRGKSGKRRKAFTWPAANPREELSAIADTILAALEPDAEKQDPRSWFGRLFDHLTGATYLNYIPVVAKDPSQPERHWLSAKIMEDKQQGALVTLYEEYENRTPIWFRLPVDTFRLLKETLKA